MKLSGFGLVVTLPIGWEGRIYRRITPGVAPIVSAVASGGGRLAPAATGWLGDRTEPVVHLANFPLPADRGDYGSGAVELMRPEHIFIAVLEFGPDCRGTALFAPAGLPRVTQAQFDPSGLQRAIPGQAGWQAFFTEQDRPLCVYAVLGSAARAGVLTPQVNACLDAIVVGPR